MDTVYTSTTLLRTMSLILALPSFKPRTNIKWDRYNRLLYRDNLFYALYRIFGKRGIVISINDHDGEPYIKVLHLEGVILPEHFAMGGPLYNNADPMMNFCYKAKRGLVNESRSIWMKGDKELWDKFRDELLRFKNSESIYNRHDVETRRSRPFATWA